MLVFVGLFPWRYIFLDSLRHQLGGLVLFVALSLLRGIDSATGGACSTLVKGRGPGSELHISTSGGDCLRASAVRRRCRRFLGYTLPSSVITWYECQPLLGSIVDYTWGDGYERCSPVQVAGVLWCHCCNRRSVCSSGHEEAGKWCQVRVVLVVSQR